MSSMVVQFEGHAIAFQGVAAGDFLMGTDDCEIGGVIQQFPDVDADWLRKETPKHRVWLPAYWVMTTPVTVGLWRDFLRSAPAVEVSRGWSDETPTDHPVTGIELRDLICFGDYLSHLSGYSVSVPSEAQWERAARGADGREYPWGQDFEPRRCNTKEAGIGGTSSVYAHPSGVSPVGALDMAGNVEEWTTDLYSPYPGGPAIRDAFGGPAEYYVTRGGSWDKGGDLARCARRHGRFQGSCIGGRLVLQAATA